LDESHKLNPQLIDEGPKPKKWQIKAKPKWQPLWRENNWFRPEFFVFKNLKRELMIWRTKMQARGPKGMVELKDSICFKCVQIGSYEFGPQTPV